MIAARALRVAAVAIAMAGLADPTWTREVPVPQPLVLATIGGAAPGSEAALLNLLGDEYEVSVRAHGNGALPPCPAHGACVIVSDGSVPARVTRGATVIGALHVDDRDRDVTIQRVETASRVHASTMPELRVHLRARTGEATRVQVFDRGAGTPGGLALVGEASHRWNGAAASEPRNAVVPVRWVPLAPGVRPLRVVASTAQGARMDTVAEADIGVEVHDTPTPVVLFEPETTWQGTFVRRALEADARFALRARATVAPSVAVSRGRDTRLTREVLATTGVVVITAPQLLTGGEIDLLDRFVRVRGGSVLLIPDRMPTGPVTRLMPLPITETRAATPQAVGPLRASELLVFPATSPGVTVLEQSGDRAVIVSRASGRGRVVVSGAMDAWRYRTADSAFARFWSTLVADAALAAGHTLSLSVADSVLRPGETTDLTVEWRTLDPIPLELSVDAMLQCSNGTTPLRLWPDARRGRFTADVTADAAGPCRIRVRTGEITTEAGLLVVSDLRRPISDERLRGVMAAHGGIVVTGGDEPTLAARVREVVTTTRHTRDTRPMRSPWWLLPFAACLGGEWFLRRRSGAR